jgi:hypothetical protein
MHHPLLLPPLLAFLLVLLSFELSLSSLSLPPSLSLCVFLFLFLAHCPLGPSVLTEEQSRLAVASRGIPRAGLGDFADDYFISTLLDSIANAANGYGLRAEDRVKV